MAITAVLIASQPVVRTGLRTMLSGAGGIVVIAESDNLPEGHRILQHLQPSVAILDGYVRGRSGFDLVSQLVQSCPNTRCLVFSDLSERAFAVRALRAGAWGFVSMDSGSDRLVEAVLRIADGKMAFSDTSVMRFVRATDAGGAHSPEDILSEREMEVFSLIGRGLAPADIADCLGISLKTVYKHSANIKEHLGLSQGSGLTHFATSWLLEGRFRPASQSNATGQSDGDRGPLPKHGLEFERAAE